MTHHERPVRDVAGGPLVVPRRDGLAASPKGGAMYTDRQDPTINTSARGEQIAADEMVEACAVPAASARDRPPRPTQLR